MQDFTNKSHISQPLPNLESRIWIILMKLPASGTLIIMKHKREGGAVPFHPKMLALDAMGVIYAEPDDGPKLLYPFIVENGGCSDIQEVIRLYSAASLGKMSSAEFWKSVGVDPEREDTYLLGHRLSEGLPQFLDETCARGMELWCLSNDVSEWSKKLRKKFGLERRIKGFVISGDAGVRKPEPAIYLTLLEQSGFQPHDVVFVDDRLRNAQGAEALGITAILFNPAPQESQGGEIPIVRTFAELLSVIYDGPRLGRNRRNVRLAT
jgi:putative hydrolase of the HAD superfamily